jgi:hypothetical protein
MRVSNRINLLMRGFYKTQFADADIANRTCFIKHTPHLSSCSTYEECLLECEKLNEEENVIQSAEK